MSMVRIVGRRWTLSPSSSLSRTTVTGVFAKRSADTVEFQFPQLQPSPNYSLTTVHCMSTTTTSGNDSKNSDALMSMSEDNDSIDPSISFQDTSYVDYDVPLEQLAEQYAGWTNEELLDTSTIPGWELIHSPPLKRQAPIRKRQEELRQLNSLNTTTSTADQDAKRSTPTTLVLQGEEYIPRGALVGTVVSTKMQKTINVAVDRYRIHQLYKKRIRYTRKFMAHDEAEIADQGDLVMIVPCQRISKQKHFLLREIIKPKGQL